MLDDQNENAGMKENLDFEVELIYKSCPMLQNKELQEAYGCQEPYDIVLRCWTTTWALWRSWPARSLTSTAWATAFGTS